MGRFSCQAHLLIDIQSPEVANKGASNSLLRQKSRARSPIGVPQAVAPLYDLLCSRFFPTSCFLCDFIALPATASLPADSLPAGQSQQIACQLDVPAVLSHAALNACHPPQKSSERHVWEEVIKVENQRERQGK